MSRGGFADRPIETAEEDLLSRGPFAAALGQALLMWPGEESLIVALCGPWGCGKTSVKNLAKARLGECRVLEFNPWKWSGSGSLERAFFEEVALALGKGGARRAFRRLASRVSPTVARAEILLRVGGLAVALILGVLALGGWPRLAATGLAALAGSFLLSRLTELRGALTGIPDKGIEDLRREAESELRKGAHGLVVIIDDLDRLLPEEIPLVLRLVKANADLPRLTYLLLFDYAAVTRALELKMHDGEGFLEKIVQMRLDVPQADAAAVRRYVAEALGRILTSAVSAAEFERDRWARLFGSELGKFFRTLRDAKRFLAAFEVAVGVFKAEQRLEVNAVDLIALEAVRLFVPEVYGELWDSKELLLQTGVAREEAADRKRLEELSSHGGTFSEATRGVLRELFPQIAWALGGYRTGGDGGDAYRRMRVCSPKHFDRYFRFFVAPSEIRRGEIDDFIVASSDQHRLLLQLEAIREAGKLPAFLRALDAHVAEIEASAGLPLAGALFEGLDRAVPEEAQGLTEVPADVVAMMIVYRHVRQWLPDSRSRLEALTRALESGPGLYLPGLLLAGELQEETHRTGERLLDPADAQAFKEAWLEKLRRARDSGPLLRHERLMPLLVWWRAWADPEEVRAWLAATTAERDGLFRILRAFKVRDTSYGGDGVVQTRDRIETKALAELIALENIRARLDEIEHDAPKPDERALIDLFKNSPDNPMDPGWLLSFHT